MFTLGLAYIDTLGDTDFDLLYMGTLWLDFISLLIVGGVTGCAI